MTRVHATIAHQDFLLDREEVERVLSVIEPEPLDDHFVVVAGRRFPPKQVITALTGLDRADFNSHQARRILSRLGFIAGRRSRGNAPGRPGPSRPNEDPDVAHRRDVARREAEALRPYIGQWVAQVGIEVIFAASTPQEVLQWLERNNRKADGMFRVPANESEMTGAAPA